VKSLLRLLSVLVAVLIGLSLTPTTAVHGAAFTYDVPTIALVDACESRTAEVGPDLPSYVWEQSASPSVEGRGASTTPTRAVVATNTRLDASTLKMTKTVEQHLTDYAKDGRLSRPYGGSIVTIQEIIDAATPVADPQGAPGACRWDVAGTFRGSSGTWQLVIDINTGTILHFLFK
jgi:hypothetical protein